jgi:intron-binding protein aquarius
MPSQKAETPSQLHSRPTVADLQSDNNYYAEVAQKHWLGKTKQAAVKPNVVKEELWDKLEKDGFAYGSLLVLETLQVLEQ